MHTSAHYFCMKNITLGKSGNPNCPFEVRWSENGKTIRKRFKLKIDALDFLKMQKSEENFPENLQLSIEDRIAFNRFKMICLKKQIDYDKAINIISEYINPNIADGFDWQNAVRMYLAECERRNLRKSTYKGYVSKLSLFERRESVQNVAEITQERAENYLANIPSPAHALRVLRTFFAFCCDKKWIVANPFLNVKMKKSLTDNKLPSVLSVEDAKRFFGLMPEEYLPELSLMAFAGIRPMELLFNANEPKDILKVGDINFKNKTIRIRSSVAKTRTERLLIGLPDNLWEFLKPLKNKGKDENVAVSDFDRNYNIRCRFGAGGKDILRHSFGSYGYHFLGAEHTVEIMGHIRDFKTFVKNYKGLASKEDSVEYFSILPNYQSRQ